ncbi:hypothetical protein [Vagococcus fluvialis]|uniref:hypothetical protein n=1 Tax=Vagococcus fluvialis TaxID=2738 RepID=UPI001A8F4736|nr:hypothetical protein [Vagococcus fluvialis]MBO0488533.1 hypothetical protein [Vagococcus fluvialis]MCM2139511.1 hypothetical protein [Vagococcus fluvialis]MDT2782038.1 hypothetical protein [Vagococcus fluvialis]
MKKVIVSAFCSVVLLGTLGGAVAQASELPFANEENTSLLQSVVRSEGIQSRSGYINGIYYRVMIRTGNVKPRPFFNGMRLVSTMRNNGVYYGYYR